MYINVAYTAKENPNIEDLSVPLRINNCGFYRIIKTPIVRTYHPEGRNDYQLLYIASGRGHFFFDDEEETIVEKGHMVLFRPKESQVYCYYSKDATEVYWVHFTGADVENLLKHYGLPEFENVFFSGTSPDYQWLFNQLIEELQLKRTKHEELLGILLKHILLMINRYAKESEENDSDVINEIERAVHYFNENYNENINIEQYAKEHLMSRNWFINCFKRVMKTTPLQYILMLRISNAKHLLEASNKNISEIAEAVGYDNPLYFSRLFKKMVGVSPSEYKALHTI